MEERIKILEYNIKEGFHDEGNSERLVLNKKRLINGIKIIEEENPDILVLLEAGKKSLAIAKKENSWRKILIKILENKKIRSEGICFPLIITKLPIITKKDSSKSNRWGVYVKLKLKKGDFSINVVHPHPSLDDKEKSDYICSSIRRIPRKHIICGDFNSLSHKDKYNKKKLIKLFSKFKENPKEYVRDALKCNATKRLGKSGYLDTFLEKNKKFDFTIPTNLISKNKDSAMRIDYIFCSKDFRILKSGILKNKFTEQASDHYPIYAILEKCQ